jgi:hypothetical protein
MLKTIDITTIILIHLLPNLNLQNPFTNLSISAQSSDVLPTPPTVLSFDHYVAFTPLLEDQYLPYQILSDNTESCPPNDII